MVVRAFLVTFAALWSASACTLITDVDRSRIPQPEEPPLAPPPDASGPPADPSDAAAPARDAAGIDADSPASNPVLDAGASSADAAS